VINGEKIFVTAGDKSWCTEYEMLRQRLHRRLGFSIDPSAGRAGMRAFVIEAGDARA
jgi:hypothetical protein